MVDTFRGALRPFQLKSVSRGDLAPGHWLCLCARLPAAAPDLRVSSTAAPVRPGPAVARLGGGAHRFRRRDRPVVSNRWRAAQPGTPGQARETPARPRAGAQPSRCPGAVHAAQPGPYLLRAEVPAQAAVARALGHGRGPSAVRPSRPATVAALRRPGTLGPPRAPPRPAVRRHRHRGLALRRRLPGARAGRRGPWKWRAPRVVGGPGADTWRMDGCPSVALFQSH